MGPSGCVRGPDGHRGGGAQWKGRCSHSWFFASARRPDGAKWGTDSAAKKGSKTGFAFGEGELSRIESNRVAPFLRGS
eukprot:1184859-Prorocentrum_minimum.AAC.2